MAKNNQTARSGGPIPAPRSGLTQTPIPAAPRKDITADEVMEFLRTCTDTAQLNRIKSGCDFYLKSRMKRAFRKGDLAAFDAKGQSYVGVVERVNQKTVSISDTISGVQDGRNHYQIGYRVSPTILREPTEKERAAYRDWRVAKEKEEYVFLVFDGRINYGV